jgi:transposase InsO family protein
MLAPRKEGARMPWQECSRMSERQEFVALAQHEGANIAELCRHFGISRKTGYKWLGRAIAGETELTDRSRRPHTTPGQTPAAVAAAVLAMREEHPTWGGRKLHHALARQGMVEPPAPSTITAILRREGLLSSEPPPRDFVRFEHPAPNDLWQLDFMGPRAVDGGRVHPLTLLDDHSRFALTIAACGDQQHPTVQAQLTAVFRRYGLPRVILCDNGSPWGPAGEVGLTRLEAWWLRLGIEPWHGRPYHPQTQGKVERLHGTIAADVFGQRQFADLVTAQAAFDAFRAGYNHHRPHQALADAVPADRYRCSPRRFPEQVPEIGYGPDDTVCRVTEHGSIQWQHRRAFVSRGLVGEPVGVRPTAEDGVWHVFYCQRHVATIDRRQDQEV